MGIEPTCSAWKADVLPLNYTRLIPALHVMVEGVGFEPTKAEPTDLQSAPVDRLGTPPKFSRPFWEKQPALSTKNNAIFENYSCLSDGLACHGVPDPGRFLRSGDFAGEDIIDLTRKIGLHGGAAPGRRRALGVGAGRDQRPERPTQGPHDGMGADPDRERGMDPGQPGGRSAFTGHQPGMRPGPAFQQRPPLAGRVKIHQRPQLLDVRGHDYQTFILGAPLKRQQPPDGRFI